MIFLTEKEQTIFFEQQQRLAALREEMAAECLQRLRQNSTELDDLPQYLLREGSV